MISWCLPIRYAPAGLRAAFQGLSLQRMGVDLVWLVAFTGVMLPLSLVAFSRVVRRAKIDGALEHH